MKNKLFFIIALHLFLIPTMQFAAHIDVVPERYQEIKERLRSSLEKQYEISSSKDASPQTENSNSMPQAIFHAKDIWLQHLNKDIAPQTFRSPTSSRYTQNDIVDTVLCEDRTDIYGVIQLNAQKNGKTDSIIGKVYKEKKIFDEHVSYLQKLNCYVDGYNNGRSGCARVAKMLDIKSTKPASFFPSDTNGKQPLIIFLEKAEGTTLLKWLNLYVRDSSRREDMKEDIKIASMQIGNFHKHTSHFVDGKLMAKLHVDLHMGNIAYNEKTKTVTLFDNDRMGKFIDEDAEVVDDLSALFYYHPASLRMYIRSKDNIPEAIVSSFLDGIEDFLNLLKEGYLLAFADSPRETQEYLQIAIDFFSKE